MDLATNKDFLSKVLTTVTGVDIVSKIDAHNEAFISGNFDIDALHKQSLIWEDIYDVDAIKRELIDSKMKIYVKNLTGKTMALNVLPSLQVEKLKYLIREKEGIGGWTNFV